MFRSVLILAGLVVAIDQATKLWALSTLSNGGTVDVIGELLQFHLAYNSGAAFSIGTGFTWVFTLVAAVVVIATGAVGWRVRSRSWAVAIGLVLGGATTHLLDRLLREPGPGRGHVVDFIDYAHLFIGNVADIALVVGVWWAAVLHLRGVRLTAPSGPPEVADPRGG